MKNKFLMFALLGLLNVFAVAAANALTNADIIKMVGAGLDESVIISTITAAPSNSFDTSVDGLIALKEAKVPAKVIGVMVGGISIKPAATKADTSNQVGPEEILMLEKSGEIALTYRLAEIRQAARGLGFGGVAVYNVLRGAAAERRLSNTTPVFMVAVPKNAQVESYITLASFATRKNGSREVMCGGGGIMGVSGVQFGITKDRIVEVSVERLANQSRAKDGFVLYTLKPKAALAKGEYAFVVTPSQGGGPANGAMGQMGSPCYDFGVD